MPGTETEMLWHVKGEFSQSPPMWKQIRNTQERTLFMATAAKTTTKPAGTPVETGVPHRNLAVELLQKLIKGELSTRRRQNVIQARSFAGMLEDAIRRYQNRTVEAAQVIEELIELAKEMREDFARGEELGLNEDELAFYDALETNDSAVKVLGDETLRTIAQELVETVRRNATIDWTVRESVRAGMRNAVRRVLRKHGYPPDKEKKAIDTVIEQAELLSEEWTNI